MIGSNQLGQTEIWKTGGEGQAWANVVLTGFTQALGKSRRMRCGFCHRSSATEEFCLESAKLTLKLLVRAFWFPLIDGSNGWCDLPMFTSSLARRVNFDCFIAFIDISMQRRRWALLGKALPGKGGQPGEHFELPLSRCSRVLHTTNWHFREMVGLAGSGSCCLVRYLVSAALKSRPLKSTAWHGLHPMLNKWTRARHCVLVLVVKVANLTNHREEVLLLRQTGWGGRTRARIGLAEPIKVSSRRVKLEAEDAQCVPAV